MSNSENISIELHERLEAYLLNKMSNSEKSQFEIELSQNPDLENELEVQKQLMLAVEVGALRGTLNKIHEQTQGETISEEGKSSKAYFLAIAACFIAVLSVSLWLFNKPNHSQKLFANYVQYDPGLPVPMSTIGASNVKMQYQFFDAMVDYKNAKFEKAITKWDELLHLKPHNDTLTYYIGAAYFGKADYNKAAEYFTEVETITESAFHSKSQFYLVLSLLQTGDLKAIESIKTNQNSVFSKDIEAIKKSINEHP